MSADAKKDLLELDDPTRASDSTAPSGARPAQASCPTLIPAFDPVALAEESELRAQTPTITNELELERARVASMRSQVPPARPAEDSLVEVEADEGDLEELDEEDQVAVLLERLSPMNRVPELVKPTAQLADQLGDSKSAYVAGFVDGVLPLETIVEVAGLPQLDTLRILDRMLSQGIAVFRARLSSP